MSSIRRCPTSRRPCSSNSGEIYEQFGIRPAGGKPLNRLMLPPYPGTELPTLGRGPSRPPEEMHAPHTVGGQAFEFPFGPVRQAGRESPHHGLVTSGEEVVDLYLFTWHKHRGVEWRLRGKTVPEAIFLAERAEGLSAVAVGWAFAAAAEAALASRRRRRPSGPGRSPSSWNACTTTRGHGGAVPGHRAVGRPGPRQIALERLLRVNATAFGHRYLFGIIEPGGVSRAPGCQRAPPRPARRLRRAAPHRRCAPSTNSSSTGWRPAGS